MKRILVIGAGRSSGALLDYLQRHAANDQYEVQIVDRDFDVANGFVTSENAHALQLNIADVQKRESLIAGAELVISMLPASLHLSVVKDCIKYGVNLITPSYISPEIEALNSKAVKNNMFIMNELGLDPGIDHMSAMQMLDGIKAKGNVVTGFESFTGGLVAPESDNNPWNYKLSWNPRNVVLAGQGVSKFLHNSRLKFIPYNKLFKRTEVIRLQEHGSFEGYANRDSLKYQTTYGLENVETMFRGTLRRLGYSRAWDCFVELGVTDDSYVIDNLDKMTFREFFNMYLPYHKSDSVELKLKYYLGIRQDEEALFNKLEWLGIFENKRIPITSGTPAQVLQLIIEDKWKMAPDDKDMCVMYHKVTFKDKAGKVFECCSHMVAIGNEDNTAMASTVGLPIGIFARRALKMNLGYKGVMLPLAKDVYEPVLKELEEYGVRFEETITAID
jgi:saccharopine dehydrogenase-like NADP-dependent oxidoreductase